MGIRIPWWPGEGRGWGRLRPWPSASAQVALPPLLTCTHSHSHRLRGEPGTEESAGESHQFRGGDSFMWEWGPGKGAEGRGRGTNSQPCLRPWRGPAAFSLSVPLWMGGMEVGNFRRRPCSPQRPFCQEIAQLCRPGCLDSALEKHSRIFRSLLCCSRLLPIFDGVAREGGAAAGRSL